MAGTFVGSPSPPVPAIGLPMYIGSENEQGYILNGLMTNFRWNTTDMYNTGAPFVVPTSDLIIDTFTIMLTMQGYDFASSLVDQSGYGNNIIPGKTNYKRTIRKNYRATKESSGVIN